MGEHTGPVVSADSAWWLKHGVAASTWGQTRCRCGWSSRAGRNVGTKSPGRRRSGATARVGQGSEHPHSPGRPGGPPPLHLTPPGASKLDRSVTQRHTWVLYDVCKMDWGKMNAKVAPKRTKSETGQGKRPPSTTLGVSKLAQVRLRPDEMAALRDVMRTLHLDSTSDALREGLRLLSREAAEVGAAEEIRAFYAGEPVPIPAGVTPVSDADLEAADESQW